MNRMSHDTLQDLTVFTCVAILLVLSLLGAIVVHLRRNG